MIKASKILHIVLTIFLLTVLVASMTGCETLIKKVDIVEYEIKDKVNSIAVNSDTADITFFKSEDGKCKVQCYDDEYTTPTVTINNGLLKISLSGEENLFNKINFGFYSLKINIYLPEEEYGNLSAHTDTGDIKIPSGLKFYVTSLSTDTGDIEINGASLYSLILTTDTGDVSLDKASVEDEIKITTDTGEIKIENSTALDLTTNTDTGDIDLDTISCENLNIEANTGDISLENVIATGKFNISSDTGDVEFDRCDANEILVNTNTGDVEGTFLSDKIIFAQSSTGKVNVPRLTSGGKCEITTDTGDIKIKISGK